MNGPLTLGEYREAFQSGALTPSAAIRQVFARIASYDDPAIFITLRAQDDLVAEAEALERKGPAGLALYGIPVAVKDNIDVAGLPTTASCPDFAYRPEADATVVARLKAAGALIVGKTNLDQFAAGLVGVRSPYGVPRNTLRSELVPGGSSSGSGVAVAAGLVPIALGTDTAGSGRVPAGLNNIVGLKPTLGACGTIGLLPACRTLDTVSVFALTVQDAWDAYAVIAGHEPQDPYSRPVRLGAPSAAPKGLRIGVPDNASRRFGGDEASAAEFDKAVDMLGSLDALVSQVDLLPLYEVASLLYDGPWVAERYQAIRSTMETSPGSLLPVTRSIIEKATNYSAADAFAGRYRLAELKRHADAMFRDIDILMVPTFPRPRTLADLEADPIGPNSELGTYTNFVNLLDLAAIAVPGGFRPDGLPAGVTLIGPAGTDALLASLGDGIHHWAGTPLGATGRRQPPRPRRVPQAIGDEIEIVVVGAHMSGLALNGELEKLGGRFLRAVKTTRDYRLYALSGGPPQRPGLVRVPDGAGAAIEAESWALSPASFGRFVAMVPAPLTIGTVRLEDGSRLKGFLAEPEGIAGAEDITSLGGWRAYLER